MRIKTNVKEDWIKVPETDVELHVKPFAFSNFRIDDMKDTLFQQFNFCVTGWKNVNDENGKPLECNEDNKKIVFDYIVEVRDCVFDFISKFTLKLEDREKN